MNWIIDLLQDARYAARGIAKSPGFAMVAVVSLALGIGANSAIFSALNAVLLRTLPVRDPHELRLINWVGSDVKYSGYNGPGTSDLPGGLVMGTSFSYPVYRALRDGAAGFSDVFAFSTPKSAIIVGHGEPATTSAMLVSGNYFSGYGAGARIGRTLVPEDDTPGAPPAAVITDRWWEQHCGSDPNVIGKSVTINKAGFTVVGVLPRDYLSPDPGNMADFYVPLAFQPQIIPNQSLASPDRWWVQVMGRLAPGANEAQAQAGLSKLFVQQLPLTRAKMERGGIMLEDGSRGQLMLRRELAKPFYVLTAVTLLVLLIACANLAGLLLARGAARQHEMAVRAAMGSGRWRIIRQSLVESMTLALTGAALGWALAAWGKQALLGFLGAHYSLNFDLSADSHVLLFTLGVTFFTGLIFGILPALRASLVDPAKSFKSRSAMGSPRLKLGKALVAIQVGLSVLLVVGAGLMLRTFSNLARVSPGFDPENVLLFRVRAADAGYSGQQIFDVYERIRQAVAAIPGARSASFAGFPLVSGTASSDQFELQGEPGRNRPVHLLEVGDDFFRTMSIPLVLGRDFGGADTAAGAPVTIVNETFARKYFPGENPIGKTFVFHHPSTRSIEIIGVARDARYKQVRDDIPAMIYLPQRQSSTSGVSFAIRSSIAPLSLLPAARRAVAMVDPNLPLSLIRTQEDVLDQSTMQDRLFAWLCSALALLAVALSCIGLYGLLAFAAAQRTGEIGLRMALGASPGDVARPMLREAAILAVAGLAFGIPVALVLARLIQGQLYRVEPGDPATLIAAAGLLMAVALAAAWIPARRAMKLHPMEALRAE